jgi:hypothetical protein
MALIARTVNAAVRATVKFLFALTMATGVSVVTAATPRNRGLTASFLRLGAGVDAREG